MTAMATIHLPSLTRSRRLKESHRLTFLYRSSYHMYAQHGAIPLCPCSSYGAIWSNVCIATFDPHSKRLAAEWLSKAGTCPVSITIYSAAPNRLSWTRVRSESISGSDIWLYSNGVSTGPLCNDLRAYASRVAGRLRAGRM